MSSSSTPASAPHSTSTATGQPATFFLSGFLAVPLFFLLSGFILAYTYEGQIEKPGDHRRFWEARFARIWPVYAVSLLLASIPSLQLPPLSDAAAALAMVQAWNPFNKGLAGAWNMVCWTLSVEAVFYIVFPWVQTWIEERSTRVQLLSIVLMLLLCLAVNSTAWVLGYDPQGILRWVPIPLPHLPEFFAGVAIGNYFLRRLALRSIHPTTPILPGNGLWTYASIAASIALLCCPVSRWTPLVVAAFAALLFGLAAETTLVSRLLSTRTMLLGGSISYSIYLMQMQVKLWVRLLMDRASLGSESLRFSLSVLALVGVSWLLFRLVEDPARRVLRRLFANLEARRDQASQKRVAA